MITEVKPYRHWSVPRWVSVWEYHLLYKLGCVHSVLDKGSELEIIEQSSNCSRVPYIHLHENTFGK